MKTLLNILILLCLTPTISKGQKQPCQSCECILKRARETTDFEEAIKQFNSARNNCPPDQTATIDAEIIDVFKKINQLRIKAEKSQKDLKVALDSANKATIRANQKTKEAEQQTALAKRTARQSKSKELAANALLEFSKDKNTEGGRDETVALRLVYSALSIDTTKGVQDVFGKIIFNADNQYYQAKVKGDVSGFNRDSSRFWTYDFDSTRLTDWTGRIYSTVKGDVSGFNQNKSLIYFSQNNYTAFYDWDGQLTGVYPGEVFIFKADGQHVVMRKPFYDGYILETRRLYHSIHNFMQHEVADFTPEEREKYGVDDYPKD